MQEHLLTFEQEWTDEASGRTLPKFVLDELHGQFVVTMPFPLRFPLAFDGALLGQVLRIFTDTVAKWYRDRHAERGLPDGETGAVTAIQRANSDLRLSPHFHTLFLDGVYSADHDGKGRMFHPAPAPSQEDIELLVERASKRILRLLERRGVITLVTAPGDGEITLVTDETLAEKDPLLAKLLAAAAAGVEPAGPACKRQPLRGLGPTHPATSPRALRARPSPIRIVLDPDERPVGKGALCGQTHAFNLQAATRVAANDKQGRERLCRYILRPPLANDRLTILDDGNVRLDFKRPWSNGTSSVDLAPLALIARLAALVPPPRRHTVLYCGVLSSHASSRREVVPGPPLAAPPDASKDKPKCRPKYIRWSDLLRRVFGIETICPTCLTPLRLLSLIKSETIAKKILVAMHLPAEAPDLHPARPPPHDLDEAGGEDRAGDDWLN
jgi:hypothetical protein